MSRAKRPGLFELSSPYDLFRKCQHEMQRFQREPTHYNLFNLVVSLTHLRDWIWPPGHERYSEATPETQAAADFHKRLHEHVSYDRVRELCNSAKHFNDRLRMERQVVRGARAGLARAGDSINHTYYLVAGTDLRNDLFSVMREYATFFRSEGYEIESA